MTQAWMPQYIYWEDWTLSIPHFISPLELSCLMALDGSDMRIVKVSRCIATRQLSLTGR